MQNTINKKCCLHVCEFQYICLFIGIDSVGVQMKNNKIRSSGLLLTMNFNSYVFFYLRTHSVSAKNHFHFLIAKKNNKKIHSKMDSTHGIKCIWIRKQGEGMRGANFITHGVLDLQFFSFNQKLNQMK